MFLPATIFTAYCVLSELVSPSHGILSEVSTGRFPRPEGNLLTSIPTFQSLASHAKLGSKGGLRSQTGEFYKSARGGQRTRLIQTYSGLDVFGPSVVASADNDGIFTGETFGEVAKNLDKEIRFPNMCQRNVKLFQNIAIRREGLKTSDSNIDKKDVQRIIFARPKKRAKIVYKVEFLYNDGKTVKWPVYLLEACTGLTLLSYNNIHNSTIQHKREAEHQEHTEQQVQLESTGEHSQNFSSFIFRKRIGGICSPYINGLGGNPKTGKRTYNLDPYCLKMEKSGSSCTMKGTYVKVVDNFESTSYNKQEIITFACVLGYKDGVNGAYGVANDAFFYGEESGRFFEEKYNMRALPYIPRMVVHYGSGYDNAFWDGTDMYFGDGRSTFYPLTGLDVVAHELAHGITTRNSNLVYAQQSGGINEAFSDITAETTKHFATGNNGWEIGADIFKTDRALRYLDDPEKDGRSIKSAWQFRPFTGVHFSSGVFNHAFYHLVAKERMNIYDAYKCFLDANLNLWGPLTNYWGGACNVMQAAYDNGFNHRKVRRSFWQVGLPMFLCRWWKYRASIRAGEERGNVLVRQERSPILEIELESSSLLAAPSRVQATTEDGSDVQITVSTDHDVENIIATGFNEVSLDGSQGEVFIQLSSNQTSDVRTTVRVI